MSAGIKTTEIERLIPIEDDNNMPNEVSDTEAREYLISDEGRTRHDLILMDLKELGVFAESLEGFIDAQDERLSSQHSGPPEEYDGWWLQDVVATRLRSACFSATMDATATHLTFVCRDFGGVQNIAVPDFQRSFFSTAETFLKRVGIQVPATSDWQDMRNLYELRNQVAHNLGVLPERDDKNFRQFELLVKRIKGISIADGCVTFDRDFCSNLMTKVQTFFEVLHQEYVRVCRAMPS